MMSRPMAPWRTRRQPAEGALCLASNIVLGDVPGHRVDPGRGRVVVHLVQRDVARLVHDGPRADAAVVDRGVVGNPCSSTTGNPAGLDNTEPLVRATSAARWWPGRWAGRS